MTSNIIVAIVGLAMAASAAMGQTMTHSEALDHLEYNDISVTSSGDCSDKCYSSCTSLDGIRSGTIWQIIAFKDLSGCPIVITGGTETGHGSGGVCSHADGYKLDVLLRGNCIENFIRNSGLFWQPISTRRGTLYTARATGNRYLKESDHWDICYR